MESLVASDGIEETRSSGAQLPIRSVVRETIMGSAGKLIGIAIALAVVGVVATLAIVGTSASAGLTSAVNVIAEFLVLIGLGIAVGLFLEAFGSHQ
jgi:hypothetical protein